MQDLKVAITGGIGSGKSEVLKIISSLGYNIVSLDDVYAQLLREKSFVFHICNTFEIKSIIDGDNYTYTCQIVFPINIQGDVEGVIILADVREDRCFGLEHVTSIKMVARFIAKQME